MTQLHARDPAVVGDAARPLSLRQHLVIVAIAAVTIAVLPFSQLRGSLVSHSMVELVATSLALIVGVGAITRFFARQETLLLFLGIGFIGAGLFDGQHLLLTSTWWLQSDNAEQLWSWNPSRTFLALVLMFAWWACNRQSQNGRTSLAPDNRMYLVLTLVVLLSFVIATLTPLPRHYIASAWFGRPDEFVAGAAFAIATLGFIRLSEHSPSVLLQWLALATAVSCAGQVVAMARSHQIFDGYFMVGHLARVASYLCVFIGLLIDFYRLSTNALLSEQAVRDQAARLRAILDGVIDAVITIRADGTMESFNSAAERMFKMSAAEAIGQNVKLLMPAPYHQEHDQYLDNYLHTGVSKIIGIGREVTGLRSDGTIFPLDLSVSEVRIGNERMFTGIIRDISDLKQTMRQLTAANNELARNALQIERFNADLKRSNQELKQFAYVASHDLQEPLRKVTAFCQLLRDEYASRLDENAQTYIRYAVDGSHRMRTLVQDLLAYSRVETQGKPLEPTSADDACREAIENLALAIEEAAAEVIRDELPTVMADRAQLVRLFQNLIGNAIKYHGNDPPVVHISAQVRGELIEFRVCDNGIGIDPQYRERIFVIFQRLHGHDEYSGTGIGLAVCKRIVERAGGSIWVESVAGAGSEFCFTLPNAVSSNKPGVIDYDLHSIGVAASVD